MAGSPIASAWVEIVPSAKGFQKNLADQFDGAGADAGKRAGDGVNSGVLGSIGRLAAPVAAAFAAVGIGSIIADSISSAADLQQSVGAIDTVFKESASQIHAWADGAATGVGLTKNEYNELGTLIGTQLKNGGTAMDALAPKTNELIGLGADLSSMFGGSTKDAVDALSSALKGERDPIERYGVSLNQAAIDAKAAELGFTKVGGSLDASANQAATIALIMDQTSDATGNFAREADTLSHKQQVLNAMWADGKTQIGTALLPAVSAGAGALIAVMGPALDATVGGLNTVTQAVGGVYSILANGEFAGSDNFLGIQEDSAIVDFLFDVREAILGVKSILVDGEFTGFTDLLGTEDSSTVDFLFTLRDTFLDVMTTLAPLGDIFTGVFAAIGPQIIDLISTVSPLGLVFQALLPILPQLAGLIVTLASAIGPVLGAAVSGLQPIMQAVVGLLSGVLLAALPVVSGLISGLSTVFAALVPVVISILGAVLPLVATLIAGLLPAFQQIIASVLPVIGVLVSLITTAILPVVSVIVSILVPIIQALLPVVTTVFGVIANVISAAMTIVQGIIQIVTGIISGNWSMVWEGIQNVLKGIWDAVISIVTGAINIVLSIIQAVLSTIGSIWSALWGGITGFVSDAWNNVSNAVSTGISTVIGFLTSLPGKALEAIGNLGDLLVNSGEALIQGFIDGISGMLGAVGDAVGGVMDFVGGFFPHSPAERGPFSGSGWTAIRSAGEAIVDEFNDGLSTAAPTGLNGLAGALDAGVYVPASVGLNSGAGVAGLAGSADPSVTVVEITNKTGVRLEELIGVVVKKVSQDEAREARAMSSVPGVGG